MQDLIPFISRLPRFFEKRPTSILSNDKAIDFETYTLLPALNASTLKKPTACHMLHALTQGEDEEEKDHLKIGRLVHLAALEPDRFGTHVMKIPPNAPKKPTKAQINAKKPSLETMEKIDYWNEFALKAEGRTIVDEEELDSIEQMRDALFAHHKIKSLLTCPGHKEATIEVWNPEIEIMQKARYDLLPGAGASFLLDIKTTRRKDLSIWDMKTEIRSLGYHLQARWYIDTLNLASNDSRKQFYFAFVSNQPPYIARLAELNVNTPEGMLLSARDLCYANEDVASNKNLPIGRAPMFINAAREFLLRIEQNHPKPLEAFEAYQHEGPQLIL